jgi:hypothetical protein
VGFHSVRPLHPLRPLRRRRVALRLLRSATRLARRPPRLLQVAFHLLRQQQLAKDEDEDEAPARRPPRLLPVGFHSVRPLCQRRVAFHLLQSAARLATKQGLARLSRQSGPQNQPLAAPPPALVHRRHQPLELWRRQSLGQTPPWKSYTRR